MDIHKSLKEKKLTSYMNIPLLVIYVKRGVVNKTRPETRWGILKWTFGILWWKIIICA